MKSVGYLKTSASGLLTGTSIAKAVYPDTAIERSVRTVQTEAHIPATIQKFPITLYDGVTDYLAPTTIFSDSVVDLRRQGSPYEYSPNLRKIRIKDFGYRCVLPSGSDVTFENNKGTNILRVLNTSITPRIIIDTMTDASKWTASSGSVSGITNDYTFYYESPSSVRFNVLGGGTNGIYRTDLRLNLSDYQGVGKIFVAFEAGSFTNITGLRIAIGSNVSNLNTFDATSSFLGSFEGGVFQIVAFDLSSPSSTLGTPNYSNITVCAVYTLAIGAISNVRVGSIFASLPSPWELLYETAAIFRAVSTGNLLTTITADSDVIIYNDAAFLLLEYQFALDLLLSNGGSIASGLAKNYYDTLHNQKDGLYPLYRAANPSQSLTTFGSYYETREF